MLRLFFSYLTTNIRRSPLISFIIFIQLVLTGFLLFLAIFSQVDLNIDNSYIQNAYGQNKLFYIGPKDLSQNEMRRSIGNDFVSIEETNYSDYEMFNEQISQSEIIRAAVQREIDFFVSKPISYWGIDDDSRSEYSFYHRNSDSPGSFSDNSIEFYTLNAWAIDQNYLEIFGLQLESGRLFNEEDFSNFDPKRIPVILGYAYKEYFSIGDTFEANFLMLGKEQMTFEIIGFIKEGQFVYSIGNDRPLPLNTYIVIPYFYKTLEQWLGFHENNPQYAGEKDYAKYYLYGLGATLFTTKHYVTSEETEAEAYAELNDILKNTGLDSNYEALKIISPEHLADRYGERTEIQGYLLIIMLILSMLSIVFVSINNISSNIKTYAIHNLVGETKGTIIAYSVLETSIYCLLGFLGGYLWYEAKNTYPGFHTEPAYLPSLKSSLLLICAFTFLACFFSFIFVSIKMRSYSLAALIRGNEVRKGRGFAFYKIITFVMLVFVSICITFVTSYNWQVEHIDRYQRFFFSKDAYAFNIQPLAQENAPKLNIKHNIDVENYSLDYLVREIYDPIMGPSMRATYFKGNVELPEMTWGRYFTEEEVKEESNYVVIGKNVIEDFIEERDGKMFYKYLDKEYEVIGIMGRKGHDTTIDNWVIFTLPTITSTYGYRGSYIVDAPTVEEITLAMDIFEEQLTQISTYFEKPFSASIDIGIPNYILNVFITLIVLTAVVFGVYYIDKVKHIINVKKFLGYSRIMIFADTAGSFMFISTIAFAVENAAMWILSKTIFKDVILFSAFRINLPVLAFSFGMILLVAFLFSVFAINKSFRGSARDLKRG